MFYLLLLTAYMSALLLPSPVFFALCLVIALRFRGYACLVIAAFIDIQFGFVTGALPTYTLYVAMILVIAEFARPRLRIDVAV